MMLGAEGVLLAVVTQLRTAVPPIIQELRANYGATVQDLPDVPATKIWPQSPGKLDINGFPMIYVVTMDTQTNGPTARVEGGGTVFTYAYRCRVMSFVRNSSVTVTESNRNRLALAVRLALLRHPGILNTSANTATVSRDSLTETYSELDPSESQNYAGTYTDLQVITRELLTVPTSVLPNPEPVVTVAPTVGSDTSLPLYP